MPNFSGAWSLSQQFQARGQDIWPKPPGAPTIGTATAASGTSVSVAFTAPACTGKYPSGITNYTATSTPGCFSATGASSPVTVTGLTGGTSYTFKVRANGSNGLKSACSAASNSATPPVTGQQAYTTAGTYTWVAPTGVSKVSVVAVGGAAGGGGGLGYKNNYAVTAGNSYTVVVGAGSFANACCAGDSYFVSTATVKGGKGGSTAGGTYTGDGGGNGGTVTPGGTPGGAGAGGYSGTGGASSSGAGTAGAGGGGGGGGGGNVLGKGAGGGGGVGILGSGSNGAGGAQGGGAGGGGSGGSNGGAGSCFSCCGYVNAPGGNYGGGGSRGTGGGKCTTYKGSQGAVRIIWPGCARSFPSTCTGDK